MSERAPSFVRLPRLSGSDPLEITLHSDGSLYMKQGKGLGIAVTHKELHGIIRWVTRQMNARRAPETQSE